MKKQKDKIYAINDGGMCINSDLILEFSLNKWTIIITYAVRRRHYFGLTIEDAIQKTGWGCREYIGGVDVFINEIADKIAEMHYEDQEAILNFLPSIKNFINKHIT